MRYTKVSVPWKEGLHLRPAATIVKTTRKFSSRIQLRLGEKIADAGNVLTILMLAASFGMTLDVEANGPDEQEAMTAVISVFESLDLDQLQNGVQDGDTDEQPC